MVLVVLAGGDMAQPRRKLVVPDQVLGAVAVMLVASVPTRFTRSSLLQLHRGHDQAVERGNSPRAVEACVMEPQHGAHATPPFSST